MKRTFTLLLLVAGLIMLTTGCATVPRSSTSSTSDMGEPIKALMVSGELKFDDVPVPAGFKVVQDESYLFENDLVRVGLLKYFGRAQRAELVSFYKEQMPLYNWSLVNVIDYEKSILNFEKGGEIVTISLEGSIRAMLVISLSPKQNAQAPKALVPAQ